MNRLRPMMVCVAVVSPAMAHAAVALGQAYGVALACAAAQAVACGVLLRGALGRRRWLGGAVSLLILGALAVGASHSARDGLLAAAGVSHAILYGGLLAWFAASLRPGRTALVTVIASRLNPPFHAGMVPYTRAVTWAWCCFFAAQLGLSAVLLAVAPSWWRALVTAAHLPMLGAMAVAEYVVRRWRWRHEHYTSLRDTILGARRLWAAREL